MRRHIDVHAWTADVADDRVVAVLHVSDGSELVMDLAGLLTMADHFRERLEAILSGEPMESDCWQS